MNSSEQRTPEQEQRTRRVLAAACAALLLVGIVVALTVAFGSDDTAAPNDNGAESQPDNAPTLSADDEAGLGATTNAPSTPTSSSTTSTTSTTSAPETATTEPPLLATVTISASGDDANPGNADAPVASVERALERLEPGGSIEFEPGTYPPLTLSGLTGAADNPIRFVGAPGVVFSGTSYSEDAGILVQDSAFLEISGMSVRRALWGIYIQNSSGITIRNNEVTDIGQEAVRVKDGSSNVVIDGNVISGTGRRTDNGIPNGEGIYIGTGSPGGVDLVSNVVISNNRIDGTTDEAIDIKRPATNISIIDNTITNVVTNTSGAIVVHLNNEDGSDPNITIERNVVRDVTRSSEFRDGNCIVVQTTVRIINNVLHNCQHRGIYLRGSSGLATILHNTLVNTGDIGAIVDEGLGMDLVSMNNLGAPGADNLAASASDLVAADQGDYAIAVEVLDDFDTALPVGVANDLVGAERDITGPVTFGAIEAS